MIVELKELRHFENGRSYRFTYYDSDSVEFVSFAEKDSLRPDRTIRPVNIPLSELRELENALYDTYEPTYREIYS